MTAEDLLKKENKAAMVRAIETAEKNTSGEIRIHLEQVCMLGILRHIVVLK